MFHKQAFLRQERHLPYHFLLLTPSLPKNKFIAWMKITENTTLCIADSDLTPVFHSKNWANSAHNCVCFVVHTIHSVWECVKLECQTPTSCMQAFSIGEHSGVKVLSVNDRFHHKPLKNWGENCGFTQTPRLVEILPIKQFIGQDLFQSIAVACW